MGKGRPRALDKGVLRQSLGVSSHSGASIPSGPVYYPTEEEFKDPLEFIYKIRAEAEPYGICRIVPPESWKPPFALDLNSFTFPTKTQAIHQLQARPAACDPKTFELEYKRFLEEHCGKKARKRVVFEGEDLDLCKFFNAVKRYGGFDKVVKKKKWGDVFRFLKSGEKVSECAKHVLSQLYREQLYDYETYHIRLHKEKGKRCKRRGDWKSDHLTKSCSSRKRQKNNVGEKVKVSKVEEEDDELDQICEQCKSGLHGDVMLLCDRCDKGWHIHCLSPPLKEVPPGNWYCFDCLNSNKDSFGFVPGKQFSLEAFRRVAERAKKKWFGSGPVSRVQIEKKFWEIVEGSAGEVEVMYGSDIDTSEFGSGFPRVFDQRPELIESKLWDEYCSSPWNLNNLPKLKGSMLQTVHHSIAGVMVPWLYVGMLFSSFCWHYEDHCFYSMNYLHWGEPKCWYSVPGSACSAFEKVMRKALPDLFDAQPDLLFHLVTMLNPSVLQDNGIPVYNVLQEPGNFVITFPRSFHAGFNFGLNCAEAVNFAPADWIPHGGFSAELYRLYRKPAILSHEELLCVVAKSKFDSKMSHFLKKELLRIYNKEKSWRERLWKNGIIKSSPMSPHKCPEFVGTEEDPTCIICQQYLFLSAVVCYCRPSTFVCLEHWEHICECKPGKHRLLYRHTLAELNYLVLALDKYDAPKDRSMSGLFQNSCSSEMNAPSKKVQVGHVTLVQAAEKWLLHCSSILDSPYSRDAYHRALKEAEQFLWAGSEMDPVREMEKRLVEARDWAKGVRGCLRKVENWSCNVPNDLEKVDQEVVDKLLSFNPTPCFEAGHLKLKDFAEESRKLLDEINSAMSSCSEISKLEALHSRSCDFPINVKGSENLARRVSSAKAWIEKVRISTLETAAVEIDHLYKLKSEISELQVSLPEEEMLLKLLQKAESCSARCCEILKGPIRLKDIEIFLGEMDRFPVNVPELKLLRQYHDEAVSLISRFETIRVNIHEREDQDSVVDELNNILNDGVSLKIQIEELPSVEHELKKARCREKALKAHGSRMSLDFLQQITVEAIKLQIEGETLFSYISEVVKAAMHWEERAVGILATGSQVFEFEELIRTADGIQAILPSLNDVVDATTTAKSWLKNSKPFLEHANAATSAMLKVDTLKELVAQSKLLKVHLEERKALETLLREYEEWELEVGVILQDAEAVLGINDAGAGADAGGISDGIISIIEGLLTSIDAVTMRGQLLGLESSKALMLQEAYSKLQWCNKILSLSFISMSPEDIGILMEVGERLPINCISSDLCRTLTERLKRIRKASDIIHAPFTHRRWSLNDAEEVLAQCQNICTSFPMNGQLENAIQKHRLWQEQARQYFLQTSDQRLWSQLLQLKDFGKDAAFNCSELDMVLAEVEKVEKWKEQFQNMVQNSFGDSISLLGAIEKIKITLDRSLFIYDHSRGCRMQNLCIHCSSGFEDNGVLACFACKDCYHLRCLGSAFGDVNQPQNFVCRFCCFLRGENFQNQECALQDKGKRLELNVLVKLLSEAEDLSLRIDERNALQELLRFADACKVCLNEILDSVSTYSGEDLNVISEKLAVALKAVEVAGIHDNQGNRRLELALHRYSWRVGVNNLLKSSQKPTIQQIQLFLKEGLAINIPPKDHFRQKLLELKDIGLKWASTANKVARDDGTLSLDRVFQLIEEGENLPINYDKELKRLRSRSELYCICRKPYFQNDQRSWIACDQCDEWYHMDCLKLIAVPKIYRCPACEPKTGNFSPKKSIDVEITINGGNLGPKAPSPKHRLPREKPIRAESSSSAARAPVAAHQKTDSSFSGVDRLWWRNRKPFRRSARKRADLDCLSPLLHLQQ